MRRLILIVAMSALVLAKPKPETYRETEDFQYSRSSSDDGQKSGYYGAQRGNMGGNYERAHNMDNLAQHQMSGLVRQTDGELGEGAKTRTGSVYTAANSRGIYGSGNYDLSNLKGRNFAEGESMGSSQSHSSLTSQNSGYRGYTYGGMNSAGFSSSSHAQDSRYSGYQSSGHAGQRQIDNLQAVDTLQGHSRYENDNQAGYNMNYNSQYGSRGRSEFDRSSSNLYGGSDFNANSRFVTTPVRVVVRPGGTVAIPIAAPTYDVLQSGQSKDTNIINSDAEVLNQQTNFKPTNKVKHYESSYSYRKEWEKHNAQPVDVSVVVPTENPFPKNSELYDDAQLLQSSKDQFANANLQTAHSSNVNSEHRAHINSAASSSRFKSGFNTQQSQSSFNAHQIQSGFNAQQSSAASDTYANTYGHGGQHSGMAADLTSAVENVDLKPKSYQSSYSYHKSWERQGDPYVIKPVGGVANGQVSQRLTAGSTNSAAHSAHQYGTHSRQTQQSYFADCDCDDEGHVRVARSYNSEQEQQRQNQWQQEHGTHENLEDLGQETQSKWENLEDLGQQQQQNKWDNLQDLGQQTQNQWDNLQQLGQETQNKWDNLQNLGQQTQNQWDNLQQLGQQTQDKWDNIEDLGQQTQRDLEQSENKNLEDFSQHNQKEDVLTNFEQEANGVDIAIEQKSYTQAENHHSTSWHQTPDFEAQSNTANIDDINQQIQSGNTQEENSNHLNKYHMEESDQHQQNPWFQNQDTNIYSDNFMKPISELNDDCEENSQIHRAEHVFFNVNKKPNLFPLPQSNTGFKPWPQNIEPGHSWNLHHNHNTNYVNGNDFWHRQEYHNNQFEQNFHSNSFSTSDIDTTLQGLWDKIDNIAGEHLVTNGRSDDDHSQGFHSYNINANHMQNSFSWGNIPTYPKFETSQTNTDKSIDEKNLEQHNLFGNEEHSTSTTVKPNKVLVSNPKPVENADNYFNTQNNQSFHRGQNIHSEDEGRGDIGPDETSLEFTTDKMPKETAYLGITKETLNNKSDISIQSNTMKNEKGDTFVQLLTSVTSPTLSISTTEKSDNFHRVYIKPTTDAVLHNKPITNPQNHSPRKPTTENEEIPQNIQQQNLDQQFVDSLDQQTQGSWLQQGYDQHHEEQHFEVSNDHDNGNPHKSPEEIEALSLTKEKKTYLDVMEFNNNEPREQTTECVETPEDVQKQYLKQDAENLDQQLQSSWAGDNLQQGFDQQNLEQQFEAFQHENMHDQTSLQDFGQSVQSSWQSFENPNQNENKDNNPNAQEQTDYARTPEDIQQQQHVGQQFAENLDQQLQNSWASDNLQQGYDQQNMDQQFEVFKQHESMDDQTSIKDFGQEAQGTLQSFESVHQIENKDTESFLNNVEEKNVLPINSRDRNVEPKNPIYTGIDQSEPTDKDLQDKQKMEDIKSSPEKISISGPPPAETSTQDPGFWKSVGNKFSNAKNKVFSWFKRS